MALLAGYLALASALSANNVLTELSGNGYARQAVTLTYDPVGGVITFPGTTVGPFTGGSTVATYAGIYDASSGGNLIMSFPIPSWTSGNGLSLSFGNSAIQLNTAAQALFVSGGKINAGTVLGTIADPLVANLSGNAVTSGATTLSFSSAGAISSSSVVQTVTYAATITPNAALGGTAKVTLTGNVTMNLWSNLVAGNTYRMYFIQDGTGSRLLTLGTGFKTAGGAPTLTTAAAAQDHYDFFYDGTTAFGVLQKAYA